MIYCLGDSHVSVFTGKNDVAPSWEEPMRVTWDILPQFRTFRVGPFLAYNVGQQDHLGWEMLFSALKLVPKEGEVLLVFGEIDCRAHLVKQRDKQKRDLDDVVMECVKIYFNAVAEVMAKGYKTMVFGGIPTGCKATVSEEQGGGYRWAHYGTHHDRNEAARLFDLNVKKECLQSGAKCLSIFDLMVDDNGDTRAEYFLDAIHLSQKAMPLIENRLGALQ
jgi:hypothetical protein